MHLADRIPGTCQILEVNLNVVVDGAVLVVNHTYCQWQLPPWNEFINDALPTRNFCADGNECEGPAPAIWVPHSPPGDPTFDPGVSARVGEQPLLLLAEMPKASLTRVSLQSNFQLQRF